MTGRHSSVDVFLWIFIPLAIILGCTTVYDVLRMRRSKKVDPIDEDAVATLVNLGFDKADAIARVKLARRECPNGDFDTILNKAVRIDACDDL